MNIKLIWLYLSQISFVFSQNYVTFFNGKNPNSDQDAHVIQLKCSKGIKSLFFDIQLNKWSFSSADSCLHSLNDVLSYCQRVYPKLNVVNIQPINPKIGLRICDTSMCSTDLEHGTLFKCLHGVFKSKEQLHVPVDCQFQHLMNKGECKTTELWTKLANQKCQSLKDIFHVTNYSMIQWCDAFKDGLATFNGIEFVCCPNTNIYSRFEDENIDNQQYLTNYYSDNNDMSDSNNFEYNVKLIDKVKNNGKSKFFSYATTFFLLGFFMTVFLFISCRIIRKSRTKKILRERSGQQEDKDQDSQLNQMQINGYENPTYKFFDEQNLS